jgi:hypothetical protein
MQRLRTARTLGCAVLAGLAIASCGGGGGSGAAVDQPAGPPVIQATPQAANRMVGQWVAFHASASGRDLVFSWQERKGAEGWLPSTGVQSNTSNESLLEITPLSIEHDGRLFRALARNAAGEAATQEVALVVVWGSVETYDSFLSVGVGAEGFGSVDGGSPSGGDGDGVGVGGGLGKTLQARITAARVANAAPLGSALTGASSGLVRVKAGPGTAPALITLTGSATSTYYDEGKNLMLPLGPEQQLHSLVTGFNEHLGVTTLTEAVYRYAINQYLLNPQQVRSGAQALQRSATPEAIARLTPAQIQAAHAVIRTELNRILPARYQLVSIATLPTPVDVNSPAGSITANRYGIMQAVTGGLALVAARYNPTLESPALTMSAQLADDLTDGVIDGKRLDGQPTFAAPGAAYDPATLAQMLAAAADAQMVRFGDGSVQVAPVITVQPLAAVITQGNTSTLSVAASGPRLSYRWFRNDVAIAGADAERLTVDSAGSYRVEVSNSTGTVASASVSVTVVPAVTAPTITAQPVSAVVSVGNSATFTVVASATNASYQWFNSAGAIAGATAPSFTTTVAGTYWVVVSNSAGVATSANVTLVVNPAATAPTITAQPVSATIAAGASATFAVSASGTAPLGYQWRNALGPIAGATTSTYTTGVAGTYVVVVSNSAGSATSAAAQLTVNPLVTAPTITAQPVPVSIVAGSSATLVVSASGTAPLSYQWFNEQLVPIAGANGASFNTGTAGSYRVVVSNGAGSAASSFAAVTVINPPTITQQPFAATITQGASHTFSVVASGTAPLSYQWRNALGPIAGATFSTYTTGVAGTYVVVVTNSVGNATSAAAQLTVNPLIVAPTITSQPVSVSIVALATATLVVSASGTGPLSYQWFNQQLVPIAGANGASFNTGTAGSYRVVVSNSAGSATSSFAAVTVITAPVITTQPVSLDVPRGQVADFFVRASGLDLSYQWQIDLAGDAQSVDWGNIAGATSSAYRTEAPGDYRVLVRNTAGTVISNTVRLGAPLIQVQPTSATIPRGARHTFSVTAVGAGLVYGWYLLSIENQWGLLPAAGPSYVANLSGTYRVVVTNSYGSVTSASVTLTVN